MSMSELDARILDAYLMNEEPDPEIPESAIQEKALQIGTTLHLDPQYILSQLAARAIDDGIDLRWEIACEVLDYVGWPGIAGDPKDVLADAMQYALLAWDL